MPISVPPPVATHQLTTFDSLTRRKAITIEPGQRREIGRASGPGYLARLWCTFPGWFWPHWEPERPVDPRILRSVICRITVDDAEQPQVNAPVADLVGLGLCQMSNFAALHLGASSGGFYLAFPMPFTKSLVIEFENRDLDYPTDVFCNALYQRVDGFEQAPVYFHAFHTAERFSGPESLVIAELSGIGGRYVGCTLSAQGEARNYLSYLESPEHIWIDDQPTPAIVGTGLEDYFLGGWYFREGTFAGPEHGVPVKHSLDSSVAMYRTHARDAVVFADQFRFAFEPVWDRERLRPYAFSAVSFLYLQRPLAAPAIDPATLYPWYRIPDSDHQAIP